MDNNEYNRQLMELLVKYERKEIDDEIYKQEYSKLVNSLPTIERTVKGKNISIRKNLVYIIIFVVAISIILIQVISPLIGKEYIVANIDNIDEPIQRQYDGIESLKIGNINIEVNLIYYYELSGKVVATYNYLPLSTGNKISPIDVGIVWGKLMNEGNLRHIKWRETGTRFLHWETKDGEWYKSFGGIEGLYSNNHLVPSNNKIKNLIKKIRKGDIVRIKGYLVNMYWDEHNSSHYWESSTTRDDTGDGACEVIYVTDVKWLKAE